MKRVLVIIIVVAAIALGGAFFNRQTCLHDQAPRLAVVGYLQAMKDRDFEAAYDFVTVKMTDGKPRSEWAGTQRKMFELGGVEMGDQDTRAPQRALANWYSCAPVAIVPNILRAKDKLNNQGSTEFETYTVIKDGGVWKIDSQESLFNEPDIHKWFPGEAIPEFKDQM